MYEAIVIGTSAGGMEALKAILPALPKSFSLPIIVVQHVAYSSSSYLVESLERDCQIKVKEVEDKEDIQIGTAYFAPPGYHVLVEPGKTFSLSTDGRVNFSCPSIDVLFESASDVFAERLIGMVLTGANSDGSKGLKAIKARGGLTIVQNPNTAQVRYMPQAALAQVKADYVVNLDRIAPLLVGLGVSMEDEYGTGTYR